MSFSLVCSSSYSSAALDFERDDGTDPVYKSQRMSRRSLRLHTSMSNYGDDGLIDSSLNHSAPYSVGGPGRKDDKTLKSRRGHHSVSGSMMIVHTPRKSQASSTSILQTHNSTLNSCAASDASLLSSLLDESCIQERTVIDSFWGLDEDGDLKDQTLRTDHSILEAKNIINTAQAQTSKAQNGYFCKDGSIHSNTSPSSFRNCSLSSSVLHAAAGDQASFTKFPSTSSTQHTTVYCRDKSRRHKTGVLGICETCVNHSRKIAAYVVFIFTLLMQSVLKTQTGGKGLLLSLSDWFVWLCKGIVGFTATVLKKILQSAQQERADNGIANGGNDRHFSSMNVKEAGLQKDPQKFSGVLWKAASGGFWWLYSLFAKCLPMLPKLLILIPFLLLLALWYWGPSGLLAMLPAANKTEWRTDSYLNPTAQSSVGDSEEAQTPTNRGSQGSVSMLTEEAERLGRLEDSLGQLWDRVAGGLLRQEEQHTEILSLYNTLRAEFHRHADRESMGKWMRDLLEERFNHLKGEVEKETTRTQQRQEKHVDERQSENARLAEAEALLQTLARRTEELQRKQEPAKMQKIPVSPLPDNDSEDSEISYGDVLLAEVKRLEEALERIRDDVQGLMGCRGRCEQLDSIHHTVSDQVKWEMKALFYGSDKAAELGLPDSLLQWFSDQFVSTTELQASLSTMEHSILGNLSIQMEQSQSPSKETVTQTVQQTTREMGLTEEHVQMIVNNALKLYSEDRTGMVDYALESGGGSIVSTRCSETYETKTALMSLFGLPLWYFSQSPRVVIQPEVHPGNCWAFKGSNGYLVIGLSMKIVPTAFSLEHIPKSLSPTGNINSAPRDFSVHGLVDEQQEEGQLLGQFVYEENGDDLQTYSVTEGLMSGFQIIELRVLSNWGHPDYTCVYRFRVHGMPIDE